MIATITHYSHAPSSVARRSVAAEKRYTLRTIIALFYDFEDENDGFVKSERSSENLWH